MQMTKKNHFFFFLAKTLESSLELKPVRCFVNIQHDPRSAFHLLSYPHISFRIHAGEKKE